MLETLEGKPSLASQFFGSMRQGVERGLPMGMKLGIASANAAQKKKEKNADQLSTKLMQRAKQFHPGYTEEDFQKHHKIASQYLDQGFSLDDAISKALGEQKEIDEATSEKENEGSFLGNLFSGSRGNKSDKGEKNESLIQDFKNMIFKGLESGRLTPDDLTKPNENYPNGWLGALMSEEGRAQLAKDYEENIERPGREHLQAMGAVLRNTKGLQTAKEIPGMLTAGLENTLSLGGTIPWERMGGYKPLSGELAEYAREGLSPEEKKGAETLNFIEQLLTPALGKGAKAGTKAVKESLGLKPVAPPMPPHYPDYTLKGRAVPKEAQVKVPEQAIEAPTPIEATPEPKEIKAAKELPSEATQRRIERASPEKRLYKTEEQMKIREEQVKRHPQYVVEIEKDAADREARNKKGEIAQATAARKAEVAQKQLPQAQDAYQKAIGRVRALEDEIAKLPEAERARSEAILSMARQELQDAEFDLRNIINNAKSGESRGGIETMRKSAENKVIQLENDIAEGKVIQLKLADYNPKWAKMAKDLAKKKPLPNTRSGDFYTQVHDPYIEIYNKRIGEIDNELAKPSKSGGEAMQKAKLKEERQHLQNMVDSAEGEKSVHLHKMALREMQQRKIAKERFEKLRPTKGEEKVKNIAHEKIQERLKTKEGRENVINDAAEEAKKSNPGKEEAIEKEKQKLNETLGELHKQEEDASHAGKQKAQSAKDAVKNGKKFAEKLKQYINIYLHNVPIIGKTQHGRDILRGCIMGIADAFSPIVGKISGAPGPSMLLHRFLGREKELSPYVSSYITKWAVRTSINQYQQYNVREAYKDKNMTRREKKLTEYKKDYSSKNFSKAKKQHLGID